MRADRALFALHGAGIALAFGTATLAPRAGQAALLVPIGGHDLTAVLGWAHRVGAPLLELDTASGRVVARIADDRTLLSAVEAGIVPLAVRAGDCRPAQGFPQTTARRR